MCKDDDLTYTDGEHNDKVLEYFFNSMGNGLVVYNDQSIELRCGGRVIVQSLKDWIKCGWSK